MDESCIPTSKLYAPPWRCEQLAMCIQALTVNSSLLTLDVSWNSLCEVQVRSCKRRVDLGGDVFCSCSGHTRVFDLVVLRCSNPSNAVLLPLSIFVLVRLQNTPFSTF